MHIALPAGVKRPPWRILELHCCSLQRLRQSVLYSSIVLVLSRHLAAGRARSCGSRPSCWALLFSNAFTTDTANVMCICNTSCTYYYLTSQEVGGRPGAFPQRPNELLGAAVSNTFTTETGDVVFGGRVTEFLFARITGQGLTPL